MQISNNFKNMKSNSGKQTCKGHTTEKALKAGGLVFSCQSHLWELSPVQSSIMHTEQFMKIPVVFGIFSARP